MPGWVCLPGMLELSGKDLRKRERGGEMVRDGTECGWMDMQINNAMCGQTASPWDAIFYTVAPHQASLTSTLRLHTHTFHVRSLNDSCWSSLSPFSFTHVS